jgi:hypothetical protein
MIESASKIYNLRKTFIKYYLEECFEIDVPIKVIDYEFFFYFTQLYSPMFYYTILNLKFKNSF